jgi:hypothetical protein
MADSGMGGDNLYRQIGVGDIGANLLTTTHRGETGKSAHKGNLAANGKTGCGRHHIRLGNAKIKKPLGKGPGEFYRFVGEH